MVNDLAALLASHGAVKYGDFTLASGAKSRYYIDVKTVLTRPGVLSRIGAAITEMATFDVVAGVAVGGIPLAVAVALESHKPYAIIRKGEKGHGQAGVIVGDVSGKRTLLVEDVTTSGGSVLFGIRALREAGARVDTVVTVVDREQGAGGALAAERVDLVPLVRARDLVDG
ncbi:MAG: orotate phosphoribosyltransferase [Methanomicrobiales archaeon]|jgi:orotate phosphoribosyltransferase|nr:orotate phosphoribosyltransferase [Methanomicrobiales archaeon]MDD1645509.1 orotate phosphoribosyltransferase [Methanomicrobiales archaeon]MDD1646444.1 orotate phosphoribosyltransferase [Methanomicrobiales archaeon]